MEPKKVNLELPENRIKAIREIINIGVKYRILKSKEARKIVNGFSKIADRDEYSDNEIQENINKFNDAWKEIDDIIYYSHGKYDKDTIMDAVNIILKAIYGRGFQVGLAKAQIKNQLRKNDPKMVNRIANEIAEVIKETKDDG